VLDRIAAAHDLQDRIAGFTRGDGDVFEELRVVQA